MTPCFDVLRPDCLPADWSARLAEARDDFIPDFRRYILLGWVFTRFPTEVRSYRTAAVKLDDPAALPPVRWGADVAHSVNRLSASVTVLERILAHTRTEDRLRVPVELVVRPTCGEAVTGLTVIGRCVWDEAMRLLGVPLGETPGA